MYQIGPQLCWFVEHTVLTFVFVTSFLSFVRFSKKKKIYIYIYIFRFCQTSNVLVLQCQCSNLVVYWCLVKSNELVELLCNLCTQHSRSLNFFKNRLGHSLVMSGWVDLQKIRSSHGLTCFCFKFKKFGFESSIFRVESTNSDLFCHVYRRGMLILPK